MYSPTYINSFYELMISTIIVLLIDQRHTFEYQSIFKNITKNLSRFASGSGDMGSIPGRVIPKTQKMVLDATLLNTQHYKVRVRGKVEQSQKKRIALPTPWFSSY